MSNGTCNCASFGELVDISNDYRRFVDPLRLLDSGDWIKLMQCPACEQHWRVDEWDKYQTLYALKLASPTGWQQIDTAPVIKQRMLENHHGVDHVTCLAAGCALLALKGRAYCVDHFYATGARA